MIRMEYPKANIEGLTDREKIYALKKQLDTLTNNVQLVLESIDGDIEGINEYIGGVPDELDNSVSTISERVDEMENAVGDYGTRIDALEERFDVTDTQTITYTTAAGWAKAGEYTASKRGLYKIFAIYVNSPVTGVAIAEDPTYPSVVYLRILSEGTTGASFETIAYLDPHTYGIWVKNSTAGRTNRVYITPLIYL